MSITCPKCDFESQNHDDAKWRWCTNCEQYHMESRRQEPIFFDAIVGRMQYAYKRQISGGSKFELSHESWEKDGMIWYRSFIQIDGGTVKTSLQPHVSMQDSLKELAQLVEDAIGERFTL